MANIGTRSQQGDGHHYDDEKRGALRKLRALLEPAGKTDNVTSIRGSPGKSAGRRVDRHGRPTSITVRRGARSWQSQA